MSDTPETYRQFGEEAGGIMWSLHQTVTEKERRIRELEEENERLSKEMQDFYASNEKLRAENEQLKAALRDVYEVWAGSEGFIPETAPEAYQQKIIKDMRDYAAVALREKE